MKLLITGAWKCDEEKLEQIRKMGHSVVLMQDESQALPVSYENVEGVVCNALFLHHDIQKFTSLRYIQLTSAGLDRIPLDYIKEHSIEFHNARGVYSIPMAEYAVCGVLQLYKQYSFFEENRKTKTWTKHRGIIELFGKTVCIVGCGSVGNECAKRFKAFGCTVYGVDMMPFASECFDRIYEIGELHSVMRCADVIILSLPLNEQTYHMIDKEALAVINDGAVLINISRGSVIYESDLIAELKKCRFSAVLDVFENEPLSENNELWMMKNVIITPHNSFVGEYNGERLARLICCNLEGVKNGSVGIQTHDV